MNPAFYPKLLKIPEVSAQNPWVNLKSGLIKIRVVKE
jgi:hypothetical protein